MLNLELIRKNPTAVYEALERRHDPGLLNLWSKVLDLDNLRRSTQTNVDGYRADINRLSKEIGELLGKAKRHEVSEEQTSLQIDDKRKESQTKSGILKVREETLKLQEASLHELLLQLPNIPREDVPDGQGEQDNKVLRTWGTPSDLDFTPLPHWELGERLGIIDFQRGVKVAGSRFFILKGWGAKLERSLISFMLDLHREQSYTEVYLPALVKGEVLLGSGNLPKFGDNLYKDHEEDLWLVPTAEAPLTSLHRDEILEPGILPLRYVAYTPCFRREKAAAGKDTRGIKRVHQFDKVELYKLVEPSTSDSELDTLLADAEEVCRRLDLPYRIVQLCTGDLGFQSAKTFDIEVWASGCGEWLEVSSCSTCTDFQARRANLRYRPSRGAKVEFVHTLNGSGLALPRTIIAILESYQQADGSVVVPQALRSYMGVEAIPPAPE